MGDSATVCVCVGTGNQGNHLHTWLCTWSFMLVMCVGVLNLVIDLRVPPYRHISWLTR